MAEAFHVFGDIDNLLQVLILSIVEDRIINDDTINGCIVVTSQNCLLNVVLSDGSESILEAAARDYVRKAARSWYKSTDD